MTSCTAADVRLLVDTSLEDTQIDSLITLSETDLDDMLQGSTMTTELRRLCTILLTASLVAEQTPKTKAVGELTIEYGNNPKTWRLRVAEKVLNNQTKWHTVDRLEDAET